MSMTNKELMVGDHILKLEQGGHYRKAKITAIHNDTISCVTSNNIECTLSINGIEPIPITTDILENNGFEYNRKETELMQNIYDYNIMLFNFPLGNGFYIEWNAEKNVGMITDHGFIKFKYVHELQHVLKMCGIKKEIKL